MNMIFQVFKNISNAKQLFAFNIKVYFLIISLSVDI